MEAEYDSEGFTMKNGVKQTYHRFRIPNHPQLPKGLKYVSYDPNIVLDVVDIKEQDIVGSEPSSLKYLKMYVLEVVNDGKIHISPRHL